MRIINKIFGLKDSQNSPSMDHLSLDIKNSNYFRLKNRIVRLDNKKIKIQWGRIFI